MLQKLRCVACIALFPLLLISCGPDKEKQQQAAQERQDSLRQVRRQRQQQQRRDSLARARRDSMANARQEQQKPQNALSSEGNYSLQVGSWRSKVKAQQRADEWQKKGFNNAYVVQYGNEETGDVWFRVRLGKVNARTDADTLKQKIQNEYQAKAWIGNSN